MAFDVNKTVGLVKGGLLDAEATWTSYLGENPGWQQTATVLTGPLLIASVFLSVIFARLVGGYSTYGYQFGWFASLVIGLLMGALAVVVASFVFNFLAGTFKGAPNFSRAFAAVSLAAVPAWVANAVSALIPYLGGLLALAGGILSLVYMYRIMPLALNVPQDKRVVHFIVSLLTIIIVNVVITFALGMGGAGSALRSGSYSSGGDSGVATSGVIGEIARQADLMQAAGADTYTPPADGKLEEEQVETYISVMRKTQAAQAEYAQKMEKLSKEMEDNKAAGKTFSLSDLGKAYSGAGSMMGANNAEMEVVKSGGGNWAEHEWVKQQVRTAHLQQGEGSEAIVHNFQLYQKYESELNE
ncbi:MAG: Yip1 family protein [Halioglobus sp.]